MHFYRIQVVLKALAGAELSSLEEVEDDVISDDRLLSTLVGGISKMDLEQLGLESFYDLKTLDGLLNLLRKRRRSISQI
jgi:hypothetical protein